MRLQDYLKEEYFGRYDKWEVFKNPNPRELRQFRGVRFIVDNKYKCIYVWKNSLLHWDAWRLIILPENDDGRKYDTHVMRDLLPASGVVMANKIRITFSDSLEMFAERKANMSPDEFIDVIKKKFGWSSKHFKNWDEWLDTLYTEIYDSMTIG